MAPDASGNAERNPGSLGLMRGKVCLAVGFVGGYYLGAKAGRERYQQMRRWVHAAGGSGFVETATDKARAVIDLSVERARDLIEHETTANGADYSPSR
jgi:hypothetical protein